MDFQEGMRRVGLTVGVLGAVAASYVAYQPFAALTAQRKTQAEYEALLHLPPMQVITKNIAKDRAAHANTYHEIQNHPQGIKQFWVDDKGEIAWFTMDDGRTVTRPASYRVTTEDGKVYEVGTGRAPSAF
jgi:hypothetical protein